MIHRRAASGPGIDGPGRAPDQITRSGMVGRVGCGQTRRGCAGREMIGKKSPWSDHILLIVALGVGAVNCDAPAGSCVRANEAFKPLRGGSSKILEGAGGKVWQGAERYMEDTGMNITATAGTIAAYRAAVSLVNQSFIDDPYAALFARDSCPTKFEEIIKLDPPKLARLAVRTKFFDNFISKAVHELGIKQIVLIGAGFDARALRGRDFRWADVPPSTAKELMEGQRLTVWELDLPEIIDRKKSLLRRAGMDSEMIRSMKLPLTFRIGVDVMIEDWIKILKRYGFQSEYTSCFLLEGFLYYFAEDDVQRIMGQISNITAPGSRIGMSAVSAAAAKNGSRWQWGTDSPAQFLETWGWADVAEQELGNPEIAEGWDLSYVSPNGTQPRDDLSVKRTWYVTAKKPYPPAKAHEKVRNKVLEIWEKARPWALKALDIAHKLFTNGFQC